MTASPASTRVVIGENNADLALALAALLDLEPGLSCVGRSPTCAGVLALAERERPDAYVLDLALDDGSCIPLIRTLRAQQAHCRIIVLTGLAGPELRALCRAAGCDATLQKDGQIEPLLEALRQPLLPRTPR
jgi:DNA-binding NarL/FixJ family response regulator